MTKWLLLLCVVPTAAAAKDVHLPDVNDPLEGKRCVIASAEKLPNVVNLRVTKSSYEYIGFIELPEVKSLGPDKVYRVTFEVEFPSITATYEVMCPLGLDGVFKGKVFTDRLVPRLIK